MKFYLAPLEGNTGYIYRNAIHRFYGTHIDKYFIPFIEPHTKRNFNSRELNDLLPEHNEGMYAVPQILTKSAADFLRLEEDLRSFGYEEVNVNLGCPSGTVVSKGRGAGMLEDVEALDQFLGEIFLHTKMRVSLKTRIGISSPDEFYEILNVYNKYPLEELIIHPRVQKEFYKGTPHWKIFLDAMKQTKNPLCYNGDIVSIASYDRRLSEMDPKVVKAVMLGRGMLANPQLIEQLNEKNALDYARLQVFHDVLLREYSDHLSGDRNILFRMKELWASLGDLFPEEKKTLKMLRKSDSVSEYTIAVKRLFSSVIS